MREVLKQTKWTDRACFLLFVFCAYFASIDSAHAVQGCLQEGNNNTCGDFAFFDENVVKKIQGDSVNMASKISKLGESTFKLLAVIEFAWSAWVWAIEKDNLTSFTAELVQKMMFISFFFF